MKYTVAKLNILSLIFDVTEIANTTNVDTLKQNCFRWRNLLVPSPMLYLMLLASVVVENYFLLYTPFVSFYKSNLQKLRVLICQIKNYGYYENCLK